MVPSACRVPLWLSRLFAILAALAMLMLDPAPDLGTMEAQAQAAAPSDQEPPMPDIAKLHGKALVENACGDCHSVNGISEDPETPKLAGQKESYLRQQMLAFKNGTRQAEAMKDPRFLAVTRAQIDELARYYSRLPVVPDKVTDVEAAKRGAFIFQNGRPRVPPCASCHGAGAGRGGGMMGGGMMMMRYRVDPAEVPNLEGQHADYTLNQMNAFATGARPSQVMGQFAADLSARDRKALAVYLSGLK